MGSFEYNASVNQGSRMPIIVLIHGLGMTEGVWMNPYKGRLLGGVLPFRYVLTDLNNRPLTLNLGIHDSEPERKIKGLALSVPLEDIAEPPEPMWNFLKRQGYGLITWTQRRPSGILEEGVRELDHLLRLARRRFPGRKFILIGHSRGGLTARIYLDKFYNNKGDIAALITLSSPHRGSRIASFGRLFNPILKALSLLLPDEIGDAKRESLISVEKLIRQIKDVSRGEAIAELSPDSNLFKNLRDKKIDSIYYATFGGTNPTFTRLYLIHYDDQSYLPVRGTQTGIKTKKEFEWRADFKELFSFPDILTKITPKGLLYLCHRQTGSRRAPAWHRRRPCLDK